MIILEGIRIRSKCNWYGHHEKSTKFSLNLEKQRGAEIKSFLRHLNIRKLPEDKSKLCEEDLTEKD